MQLNRERIAVVRLTDRIAVFVAELAHVPADRHRLVELETHLALDQKDGLLAVTVGELILDGIVGHLLPLTGLFVFDVAGADLVELRLAQVVQQAADGKALDIVRLLVKMLLHHGVEHADRVRDQSALTGAVVARACRCCEKIGPQQPIKQLFGALDKTGTVTVGKPIVTDLVPLGCTADELLLAAYSLESMSEHPLAAAIVAEGERRSLKPNRVEGFSVSAGNGLEGVLSGERVRGGNRAFVAEKCEIPAELSDKAQSLAEQGKTPIYFSKGNKILGLIAVADVIRDDSRAAVAELKQMGISVVMLTGDNEKTARAIGTQAGVDRVIADVKPDGKESVIRELSSSGKVAMVGDGINDAPALTSADIGIAVGAGTDVAIEAADVVLMNSRLSDVCAAIRLGRATLRNIKENLFWAFVYNMIGIPLAAGVFIPLFGWQLNPMFGAAAMSLSSFCVVTNALRLNFVRLRGNNKDNTNISQEKMPETASQTGSGRKEKIMTETLKIEGMMCPHCEGRVKNALEQLPEVESAQVSHESGTAVVTLRSKPADGKLKEAVEAQGYKVV